MWYLDPTFHFLKMFVAENCAESGLEEEFCAVQTYDDLYNALDIITSLFQHLHLSEFTQSGFRKINVDVFLGLFKLTEHHKAWPNCTNRKPLLKLLLHSLQVDLPCTVYSKTDIAIFWFASGVFQKVHKLAQTCMHSTKHPKIKFGTTKLPLGSFLSLELSEGWEIVSLGNAN